MTKRQKLLYFSILGPLCLKVEIPIQIVIVDSMSMDIGNKASLIMEIIIRGISMIISIYQWYSHRRHLSQKFTYHSVFWKKTKQNQGARGYYIRKKNLQKGIKCTEYIQYARNNVNIFNINYLIWKVCYFNWFER